MRSVAFLLALSAAGCSTPYMAVGAGDLRYNWLTKTPSGTGAYERVFCPEGVPCPQPDVTVRWHENGQLQEISFTHERPDEVQPATPNN